VSIAFPPLARFVKGLCYPTLQADKLQCHGWTPALFWQSCRISKRNGKRCWAHWPNGETDTGLVFAFYGDVNNQNPRFAKQQGMTCATGWNSWGSPLPLT